MPKEKSGKDKTSGTWNFRGIPKDLMRKANIAAAIKGTSVKQILVDLMEGYIKELERKGELPKDKS
jgi:predicted HicB family RNase H-like nuclease